jgi:hypothetical protein
MNENIKNRVFKNWITTIIGIPILLVGLFMMYQRVRYSFDVSLVCDHSWWEAIKTVVIGYTIIFLKDTAITEGLFLGIFNKK